MKKLLLLLMLFSPSAFAQLVIYCVTASSIMCNTTSDPGTGTQGDPAWLAFGKINSNFAFLYSETASIFPCQPFSVVSNNTASYQNPACNTTISVLSIAVPLAGTISYNSVNLPLAALAATGSGTPKSFFGNTSSSAATYGQNTQFTCSMWPSVTGDWQVNIGTCVVTNVSAAGNFNVGLSLSAATYLPPTNIPQWPELDYDNIGTSGVVLVNSLSQTGSPTNGTYTNISGTGGTGSGVAATVIIAGGVTSSVTITTAGTGYSQSDTLTFTVTGGAATAKVQTRNNPILRLIANGAPTNFSTWSIYASAAAAPSRTLSFCTETDTLAAERCAFSITGTGSGFSSPGIFTAYTFGNAIDNPTYTFLGTGLTTFGGGISATGATTINTTGSALTTIGNSSSSTELNSQSVELNGNNLWISIFAPTIGAGFGSTASFTPAFSTTKAFIITASGTGQSATTALTAFGTANSNWVCNAQDLNSAITGRQTVSTITAVTITWSSAPTANDKLLFQCDAL